jgi:dUTP pyrophosphatase
MIDEDMKKPEYAHAGDAGFDLRITEDVEFEPGEAKMAKSGVAVKIPEGYVGLVFPRSGMAGKQGITLRNSVGVIDSTYRGEIGMPLYSTAKTKMLIPRGARVAQMVVVKCETCNLNQVEELGESSRGTGGFGSTGID